MYTRYYQLSGYLSKLVCSSLNIVKLMLEMTFSSLCKNCSGTDKVINRYNNENNENGNNHV